MRTDTRTDTRTERPDGPAPRTTAACLVAFPLSMLAAALAQPELGTQTATVYDTALAEPGRVALSVALGLPGTVLWVLAVTGATALLRGRGERLGRTGGVLALLGAVGHVLVAALFLVLLGLPRAEDRDVLLPALDRVAGHVFPVAVPLLTLGGLGVVLLAVALHRGGRAPLATPVLVGAGAVLELVLLPGDVGDVLLWVLVTAGLAPVATRLVGRRQDVRALSSTLLPA